MTVIPCPPPIQADPNANFLFCRLQNKIYNITINICKFLEYHNLNRNTQSQKIEQPNNLLMRFVIYHSFSYIIWFNTASNLSLKSVRIVDI
jgi:GR25 family glycosyltransferase involved in LPS biosynthesis